MPSTTVHIPDPLLSRIDKLVKERSISRNRFIIQACEDALNNYRGEWPNGFFDAPQDEQDQKLLKEAVIEMEKIIFGRRKNRNRSSL